MTEQTPEQELEKFLEIPLTHCPLMREVAKKLGKHGIGFDDPKTHETCCKHLLGYLAQPHTKGFDLYSSGIGQSIRHCGNSSVSRTYCGDAVMIWFGFVEIAYRDKL